MIPVAAVIFADHDAIALEQSPAASEGGDFQSFDIELHDGLLARADMAVINQAIQRQHPDVFAIDIVRVGHGARFMLVA